MPVSKKRKNRASNSNRNKNISWSSGCLPDINALITKYRSLSTSVIKGRLKLTDLYLNSYLNFMIDLISYAVSDDGLRGSSRSIAEPYLGKLVSINGIISGVRKFDKGFKLLIRSPEIASVVADDPSDWDYTNPYAKVCNIDETIVLDTHIWLNVNETALLLDGFDLSSSEYGKETLELIAGSSISFITELGLYKGKVEDGSIGDKIGLVGTSYITSQVLYATSNSEVIGSYDDYGGFITSSKILGYCPVGFDEYKIGRDIALCSIIFDFNPYADNYGVSYLGEFSTFIRYAHSEPSIFISKIFKAVHDGLSYEDIHGLGADEAIRVIQSYSREYAKFFRLTLVNGKGFLTDNRFMGNEYAEWKRCSKVRNYLERTILPFTRF